MVISDDTIYIESAEELMITAFSLVAQDSSVVDRTISSGSFSYITIDCPILSDREDLTWAINVSSRDTMVFEYDRWVNYEGFFGLRYFLKNIKRKYGVSYIRTTFDLEKIYTEGDNEFDLFMTFLNAYQL